MRGESARLRDSARRFIAACACIGVVTFAHAAADCLGTAPLRGVNIAGAEFNPLKQPGVANKDYTYPQRTDMTYFAAQGMNVVRVPIRWERLQPELNQSLDEAELKRLTDTVREANAAGLCVIVDVHNYGVYKRQQLGSDAVPVAAFSDLWLRIARAFPDASGVAFGLMNEPNLIPIDRWATAARAAVTALREGGARNLILVSGGRWSGAHEWTSEFGGISNARAFAGMAGAPLVIEVHQYADSDYSGTHNKCVPAARAAATFDAVTKWARDNGKQLFLGEFGTPGDADCLAALDAMLAQVSDSSVWRGWTYWAAGAWWAPDYAMSIQPRGGVDAPQLAVLRKYLKPVTAGDRK
ncbi:glycoside hydrolase family 5 protein [Uliginosibacterium sp. sgz301328]|uniref:glycoside hydrolase family 5 protein n=1 Tax=Uliginosibacterium sp. sgz301328 TaxID=3243764 RepID=UPI00359D3EC6